jgi:Fe-S cluster assembly protein SufD
MTVQTADATRSPLSAALDRRDEPEWLRALRARWWERAEATPWPTGQEEEWRRTSLDKLPRDGELALGASSMRCAVDPELVDAGLVFTDLPTAVREHADLVEPYLGTHETIDPHAKTWALGQAAWTGGTFLYVPRGVIVDQTLTVKVRHDHPETTFLPHSLIVAERGSSVTLLEDYSSPDGTPGWFGGTVDIRAGAESRVRYANLQRLGNATWNIGAQRVEVGQDASVTCLNAEVGSKVTKLGLDVRMAGKGGTSRLLGMLAAGDDQHIDIDSVQDLLASYTTSDLLYLSALYDQARAAFYGRTKVRPQAKQTSSYQECRNLLLSPEAGAEPIPVLEIETNDILRCGHGATAGAIDPTQLFYAQTRGLEADAAQRMIVRGFFEQVVGQIHDETIREWVLTALAARIGTSEAFDLDPGAAA